jgi:hypothetical protein
MAVGPKKPSMHRATSTHSPVSCAMPIESPDTAHDEVSHRQDSRSEPLKNTRVDPGVPSVLAKPVLGRSFMKLRTATFAAALLVAAVSPNLSTTAQARPFGFHGGFGHGGWGHGGWGWGGVGIGLATGALIGAAIASPYGYGYPAYGYGYGYPAGYGYAPAYSYDYDYAPAYAYAPAYGYAAATPYVGGYRRYGYGVGYRGYGVSRIGYGGYRAGYIRAGYGRTIGYGGYRPGYARGGY